MSSSGTLTTNIKEVSLTGWRERLFELRDQVSYEIVRLMYRSHRKRKGGDGKSLRA